MNNLGNPFLTDTKIYKRIQNLYYPITGSNLMKIEKKYYIVFYDGSCGLCRKAMAVIRRLDWRRRVKIYDVLADWPEIHARFPSLDQQACLQNMHLSNPQGKIVLGFKAYRELAWALPLTWLIAPFLYLPLVPYLGERIYRKIASGRHRGVCPLPPPDTQA